MLFLACSTDVFHINKKEEKFYTVVQKPRKEWIFVKKIIWTVLFYTVAAVIAVPWGITLLYHKGETESVAVMEETQNSADTVEIKVYNPETEEVVETEFEEYIKGVVGAEMPALFPEEALKAQAVAARTYAVRKMEESKAAGNTDEVPYEIGQAYMTKEELKERWGTKFNEYYKKVSDAVDATKDEIMVYENEPILAVFHSTSAGQTENAENVWQEEIPYLKSVDSIQDEKAPDFQTETSIPAKTVMAKLQAKVPDLILTQADLLSQMQIAERTEAGYIKKIQVGNKMLSGREVREALGLKSSDFTMRKEKENIVFITKGYGHGAGMSQYGASFMAQEGSSYEDILNHYYTGVTIVKRGEEKQPA